MLNLRGDSYTLLYSKKPSRKYSVKLGKLKEGEKISLISDTMFKTMFQNDKRLKYSCKFLSYYLDISYEELLANIKLVKNELDKEIEQEKGERCDYVANINGTTINIEVNNNNTEDILERNMEYAHRLYSKSIRRNKDGKREYTQVIQFNINNFAFEGEEVIIDKYCIQNERGVRLNNKLIFVQIYIPNLRKKWYNEGVERLSKAERYALCLVEPNIELSKELGGEDEVMEEYVSEAVYASKDNYIGESYDKEWALKEQGKLEGYEEGLERGKTEIAKELLGQGMPVEMVVKITKLKEEDIISLSESVEVEQDNYIGESYDKNLALKEQGKLEGLEERNIEIAKSMLNENIDINVVSRCTSLTLEELEQLKEKEKYNL